MKTTKLSLLFFIASITLYGQDSLRTHKKRHQIGVDLTSFLKYYVNFSQEINNAYRNTPYYVQYRFHLKSDNNIRAAIGGGFSEIETASPYTTGPAKYKNKQQAINYRIGFEHFENLSSRFQVFYGLDLHSGVSHAKNEASSFGGGYANGYETKTTFYGASPLLGVRFYINKRLSLFTESSFQVNINETWEKRFYTPVDNSFPPIADSPKTTSKSVSSIFNFPLFIVLAFDL